MTRKYRKTHTVGTGLSKGAKYKPNISISPSNTQIHPIFLSRLFLCNSLFRKDIKFLTSSLQHAKCAMMADVINVKWCFNVFVRSCDRHINIDINTNMIMSKTSIVWRFSCWCPNNSNSDSIVTRMIEIMKTLCAGRCSILKCLHFIFCERIEKNGYCRNIYYIQWNKHII